MSMQKQGRENPKMIRISNIQCDPNSTIKKTESLSPSQKQRIVKPNNIQQNVANQNTVQSSLGNAPHGTVTQQQVPQLNQQQIQQIQVQASNPQEERVFDFKKEIERRFERSLVNKNYIFPRNTKESIQDSTKDNNSPSSDEESFESMRGVTVYNLKNQNLQAAQKSALTLKLSEFPNEAIYLRTEGDEPIQQQIKIKTQNNFRKAAVVKQVLQQQQSCDGQNQSSNCQQDYNTLSANLQASIRISAKKAKPNQNINGRHIRYESEYQPGRNQQREAQNLSGSTINNKQLMQTNSFNMNNQKVQKNKGQNFIMLLKTENIQNVYKNNQMIKKIQAYGSNGINISNTQQQQSYLQSQIQPQLLYQNSDIRVVTEGAEPPNYEVVKPNGANNKNINPNIIMNNNSNLNQTKLISNNAHIKYKANNNFYVQSASRNYNNILSKSFHFKSTNKSKERDSGNNKLENLLVQNGSDRLNTLQSVDCKLNLREEQQNYGGNQKQSNRVNANHGQSCDNRDNKFDLETYLIKTKKKKI